MEILLLVFGFSACMAIAGMFYSYKQEQMKMQSSFLNFEKGILQNEIADLKQRMVVLEKIITSKKYRLEEELDELDS